MTTNEAIAAIRAEVEAIIGEPVDPARWLEVEEKYLDRHINRYGEEDSVQGCPWVIAHAIRPDIGRVG